MRTHEEKQRRNSGVCLGACFSRQSTTASCELTGSDARFPSKVRQIDVIGLSYVLVCNQEVAGSIPVRSTLYNFFRSEPRPGSRLGAQRDLPDQYIGRSSKLTMALASPWIGA
jgi:hypothetical protein